MNSITILVNYSESEKNFLDFYTNTVNDNSYFFANKLKDL